jgi:hypothetical protein
MANETTVKQSNQVNTTVSARPSKIVRFVAVNPDQGVVASYNVGLGEKTADSYATWNARTNRGQVLIERLDGTVVVHRDFSVKTAPKTV